MGEKFIERLQVPDVALSYIDTFFTAEDINFIEEHTEQIKSEDEDIKLIEDMYHRGVINLVNEEKGEYTYGRFSRVLDIFCVLEKDTFRSLPQEAQDAIEGWYFDLTQEGRTDDPTARVSSDIIVTKDEMIAHITGLVKDEGKQLYLAPCDCKSLKSICGVDLNTCIGWNDAPNSFAHRKVSKPITLDEAIAYVENADKNGLIHTISKFGLCNCCAKCNKSCCYLFRAMKKRGSTGYWPYTERIVKFNEEKCINCGKCMTRCQFRVFKKNQDLKITADNESCVGCGLCVDTCPAGALELAKRL